MSERLGLGVWGAAGLGGETALDRIAGMLNWGPIAYRLEKLCRKEDGRPPFPPIVMFPALLLAQRYQLSDRGLADALCDPLSFPRFLRLKMEAATPDPTTLSPVPRRLPPPGPPTE